MASYGIVKKVRLPYEQALARTRQALKTEGFGVITEIDVQKTLREKLGKPFPPYIILGACNPPLAHRAITAEPEIGLLMPCTVRVWDNRDGTCTVAAVNVEALFQIVQNPALADIADTVNAKLRRAVETVAEVGNTARAKGKPSSPETIHLTGQAAPGWPPRAPGHRR